jgi:REP element-mobilizing transposase RayT
MQPVYTLQNCRFAYQLRWSLAVFTRPEAADLNAVMPPSDWLQQPGIRLLEQQRFDAGFRFLLSTVPEIAPHRIIRALKGRFQWLLTGNRVKILKRNYALRSVGETKTEVVDTYLAQQLIRHPCADKHVQQRFSQFQIQRDVDLNEPRFSNHGMFWYNLHLVLITRERVRDISIDFVRTTRDIILNVSQAAGHLLARAAILPDHVHMTLGCLLTEAPGDVAIHYLNGLNLALGTAMFNFGAYIGTFSAYDLGAIRANPG